MLIRAATTDDLLDLAKVHLVSCQAAYREVLPADVLNALSVDDFLEAWRHLLEGHGYRNLLGELEGRVVGFVSFGPARDPDVTPQTTAEIYGMYLHPSAWARGFGRALWHESLKTTLADGYREVVLWVLADNARARRFYEVAGFHHHAADQRPAPRFGVGFNELRYRRPLRD